jgi:sugar transferase (PEP-CTERM system associated)
MLSILHRYTSGRLIILLITEHALILTGIVIAASLQVHLPGERNAGYINIWGGVIVSLVCQLAFYCADLYDLRVVRSMLQVLGRMLSALGAVCLLLAFVVYIYPPLQMRPGFVETSFLAIICGILTWRVLLERGASSMNAGERILLVGSGDAIEHLAREIHARSDLPIHLVGSVAETSSGPQRAVSHVPCVGMLSDLGELIERYQPDRVVIGLKERRQHFPVDALLKYRLRGLVVEEASTLFQKVTGRIPIENLRPSEIVFSSGFRPSSWLRVWKRSFDIVASAVGLVGVAPVMVLVACAIKLNSRGPVLYTQERVGKDGRVFKLLKFRSMRVDAEELSGPRWASEDDPRVTRIGSVIRKMRMDELPQFFNILQGDMSFIGPRPERPHFVDRLKMDIPYYDLRHSVRAGLTGWAQVSYPYGASVEDAKCKLEYDLFYNKNMSVSLDLLILFRTVKIVLDKWGAR